VAVVISGCGGGDDSTSPTTSETTPATSAVQPSPQNTTPTAQGEEKSQQGKAKSNGSDAKQGNKDNASSKNPKLVKVPPVSSVPIAGSRKPAPGVKTVKGADNSVQEYGVEADESSRREAAIALQAYLNARAQEDWGAACTYLAKRPMEQLERVQAAAAKQGTKLNGCPATMALLREGEAQSQEQAQITEVLSLRGGGDVSGDPSYLLYLAPPSNTLFSMPMYLEGGAWKVGLARAAELPVG
jgi:hypothetical protein